MLCCLVSIARDSLFSDELNAATPSVCNCWAIVSRSMPNVESWLRINLASGTFGNTRVRIMRHARRDLNAYKAVGSMSTIIDTAQDISRHTHVFNTHSLVQFIWSKLRVGSDKSAEALIVVVTAIDSFLEDSRIAGDAGQVTVLHHLLQFACRSKVESSYSRQSRKFLF